MLQYFIRRILLAIPTLFAISLVSFVLIQLPPGDFLTSYAALLAQQGDSTIAGQQLVALQNAYGLNQPVYVQYWKWISNILLHGDFGQSLEWHLPVSTLIWNSMGVTLALTVSTLLFTWLLAIPIGVFSATHQYSPMDYVFTFLGFIGLAIPGFMIALVLLWVSFRYLGMDVGGLFSRQYQNAPWSVGKVIDLLKHFWVPLVIIGLEGTAGLIRTMRANLLDELHKPYVIFARARGLDERKLTWEYPVRVALNPFVSSAGFSLPGLINGATIVGIVLSLPMHGPMLLRALLSQDMYLAGAFILLIGALTVIGVLISDLVLAWLDPRIRYA
ncbi:MAG TPA: ABC transporter permease [Thermomicrobiales bacterium]|jgi:peptide/nickel transport system permease protein|nr:ABC transporter permease [Thermomicrobiales bacterium]